MVAVFVVAIMRVPVADDVVEGVAEAVGTAGGSGYDVDARGPRVDGFPVGDALDEVDVGVSDSHVDLWMVGGGVEQEAFWRRATIVSRYQAREAMCRLNTFGTGD